MSDYSTNKKIFSSLIKPLIVVFIQLFLLISHGQAKSRNYAERAHYLDTYLGRLEHLGFSGNVLFAHKDTIYLNQGYGLANIEKNIRNRPETLFQLDSTSKQFTAAAILTLEMQGKLRVTDSITKFFEQVPPDKTEITLHHLLTHTSGIISGTTEYFEKNTKNDIIRVAMETPLKFKPGESDLYSNIGYVLLAAVVEKVSGMPFDEYLSKYLFNPAGMHHTGMRKSSWSDNTLAYRYDENNTKNSPFLDPYPDWNFIGGSGVLSTTNDLFLWHKTLLGLSVLSEEAKKKMYTPIANDYGYGWEIMKTPYGQVIMHGGGNSNGSASLFQRYLDKEVVIIIFLNQDGESRASEGIGTIITRIVFGEAIELPPKFSGSRSQADLAQFNGTYLSQDGSTINIISKKGFLEITGNGQASVTGLLSKSETEAAEYQTITDKTDKLLEGIVKNDYTDLIAVAGAKSDSRYKKYAELNGKAENYSVLGTVPVSNVENAKYMTIFRINYPKKVQIHRFYWSKEGKIIATGGEAIRQAVKVKAFPKTANQLLTYDITLARSAIINLRRNVKGRVNELIVGKNRFFAVEK